ncbi:MAG: glycerol-3-phosphate 1-O-acyltransferase PlsY [Clostridia bacterium]|nr:glycerol-3-phosphate 1-O-acyltransferase PlsY [Clostridia bacterium]
MTTLILKIVLTLVLAYLIGTFNPTYLLGKLFKKKDIHDYGSGNPGSTNSIRVFGPKFGFLCMALDIAKGALAVVLCRLLVVPGLAPGSDMAIFWELVTGIACILGHMYPLYMHFKGGKGIAASLGILLVINWKLFLIAGIPALLVLGSLRIMSVASLTFEFLIFLCYLCAYRMSPDFYYILAASAVYPIFGFYGHRSNLRRLALGTEPRLWGKGSKKDPTKQQESPKSS